MSVEVSPICLAINQICKNGVLTEQKVKHLINYFHQTLTVLDETRNNVMQATLGNVVVTEVTSLHNMFSSGQMDKR